MAITRCGPAFQQVHLASGLVTLLTRSYNPAVQARRFGLFRFRSPLLSESRLIYFPPGTEMVHFPGLARTRLCIQRAVSRVHRDGFPHSEIPGSKPACGSPRLIAACHVLRRLLAPRHPPYALSSLTIKLTPHVVSACAPLPLQGSARTRRCRVDKLAFPLAILEWNLRITAPHFFAEARRVMPALFSCQRAFAPRPAEWSDSVGPPIFVRKPAEKEKPGIERRVGPPHTRADSRDARLLSNRYP